MENLKKKVVKGQFLLHCHVSVTYDGLKGGICKTNAKRFKNATSFKFNSKYWTTLFAPSPPPKIQSSREMPGKGI